MSSTLFRFTSKKALVFSTAVATGTGAYLYGAHWKPQVVHASGEKAGDPFTVSKKTENGWIRPTFQHLGREAAEALLRKNEGTTIFKPSSARSVVTRFDNNWVGCNAVCEDRHVEDYVSKDVLSVEKVADFTENGNWGQLLNADAASLKIFSVIDGHGGTAMADALTRRLHPAIVSSLRCHLAGGAPRYTDPLSTMRKCSEGALDFLSDYKHFECAGLANKPQHTSAFDIQLGRDIVSDALSAAYTNLDYEICAEPLRDIMVSWNGEKVDYMQGPASAMSGACAVSVMVDEDSQEVYVAHTGDTRAVAGYWIPAHTDANGTSVEGGWRCEVLTADHSAQNPDEVQRLAKEHPGETVIDRNTGRVFGDLMPTRAFGDAVIGVKWSEQEKNDVLKRTKDYPSWLDTMKLPILFDADSNVTAPYVTAKPDIAVRSLEKDKDMKGHLKFIVAATDGLWDFLSSEEAVGLVASHLAHPHHNPVSRRTVQSELLEQRRTSREKCPGPQAEGKERDGDWVYEDSSAATHLIRNAFGAARYVDTAYQVLSLTPPVGRWFKDDVTCSVIFFDPPSGCDIPKAQTENA